MAVWILIALCVSAGFLPSVYPKAQPSVPSLRRLERKNTTVEKKKVDLLLPIPIDGSGSGSPRLEPITCSTYQLEETIDVLSALATNCPEIELKDCCQPKFLFHLSSDIYHIRSRRGLKAIYCDLETLGGGWIVIYRGGLGTTYFQRNILEQFGYGFGKLQKEFWLGLEHLNFFTNQEKSTELLVELVRNGTKYFALYEQFSVGNRRSGYKLSVGGYSSESTLPDSLSHNNGFKFSVSYQSDGAGRQYGSAGINYCEILFSDAWWHGRKGNESCTKVSFLRDFESHRYVPKGLIWEINGEKVGFDYGEMKIRPKSWACGNKSPYPDDVLRRAFLAASYPHLNPFKESENTED